MSGCLYVGCMILSGVIAVVGLVAGYLWISADLRQILRTLVSSVEPRILAALVGLSFASLAAWFTHRLATGEARLGQSVLAKLKVVAVTILLAGIAVLLLGFAMTKPSAQAF